MSRTLEPTRWRTRRRGAPAVELDLAAVPDGDFAADPVFWTRTRLNFHPDPKQAEVLASTHPRGMLCCTRQWGKSTIVALKALHHALFTPASLTLVVAPAERQSAEFVRKVRRFLADLGAKYTSDGRSFSLVLGNGARLVALPANQSTIRGFSACTLLIVDEAALVPDAVFQALAPTLATTNGQLWLMSTPYGQTGFFYDEWHRADPAWHRIRVTATECRRIAPEFLAWQRLSLGEVAFRQEYLCDFAAGAQNLFSRRLVEANLDETIEPWLGGEPQWN
jgi:hypothetical protein